MSISLASIGDRFTAQFIDGLAGAAVGAVVYFAAQLLGLPLEIMFIGWILYLLFCDALPGGQSLGKKFTRIAVVHFETGRPCGYWQSFARNVPLLVLGVLDCLPLIGQQRRRVGDYLAKTKVVKLKA
ncbi:MAG: RDD family protein [Aquabacterium sp.]|uniref:RDD family protein n=1 Tax=Aquabacterium sp. TaxID=1872578 RepID=UPI002727FA97|nr:RDD family protein [Aquabacterium sp.]MDO9005527.1 RDD family protein [Aquabacterium sp.]